MNSKIPSVSEQISYATVQIKCEGEKGTSSGTGFIVSFTINKDISWLLLITNKHVIEGANQGYLRLVRKQDEKPIDTEHINVNITDFSNAWIKHPDKDVDLCGMIFGTIINQLEKDNNEAYYTHIRLKTIATKNDLALLELLEDITMVGYPLGLSDEVNNKPIFRKGVIATHPKLDYNGRKEFLIDMACFPGSSGSPVFLYDKHFYKQYTSTPLPPRVTLLGVLYAGPQQPVDGEIKVVKIPTSTKLISKTNIPINLGCVIKAERIFELVDEVKCKLNL